MTVAPAVYYALLGAATLAIAGMAVLVWIRTRNIGFVIGFGFLYYWSLFGAWFLVYDLAGGTSGMRYEYLFTKLFPIALDVDYLLALLLYAVFVLIVQAMVLWFVGRSLPARPSTPRALWVSHPFLLGMAAVTGLGGFLIIRPYVAQAVALSLSVYNAISEQMIASAIPLYTVHQLLIEAALLATALGVATCASGPDGRYVRGARAFWILPTYLLMLGTLLAFSFLLGKKHEPLFALLIAGTFYFANARRPRVMLLSGAGLVAILTLGFVDLVRSQPLAALRQGAPEGLGGILYRLVSSNEAYGAHFSMYGALHYDVPVTYGSSLLSLGSAVVPRALGVPRAEDIYAHYVREVNAVTDQQYTILHPTGWYLNFGLPGLVLGGALLGGVWGWLYRIWWLAGTRTATFSRAFATIAFWAFSVGMPRIVRAGPEVYKSVVVELWVLPALLLSVAALRLDIGVRGRMMSRANDPELT